MFLGGYPFLGGLLPLFLAVLFELGVKRRSASMAFFFSAPVSMPRICSWMARAAPAVVLQLEDLSGQGSRPGVLQGLAWALVPRSVAPLDTFDRARLLRLLLFAARSARGGVQLNLLLAGLLSQEQTQVLDVIAV